MPTNSHHFLGKYDPLKEQMVQILDPLGRLNESLRPSELTDEVVKELGKKMMFCRMMDAKTIALQRTGRSGTYGSIRGQEAVQVGSVYAMKKEDWIVPAFRELAAMWMKGVPMENQLVYWMGNEIGNKIPEGVNCLTVAIPVGSQCLHAVGLAYAIKFRKEPAVVTVYFGDGATSEGDFHEALNCAMVYNVPVVFICQNNQYAISVRREFQTKSKTIAQKAIAYQMEGILVDGNDLFAMYAVTKEAIEKARSGGGSTLIEAYTYRFGDHTTADDATRYRPPEEVEMWKKKDPLLRLQKYMESKHLWDKDEEAKVVAEFEKEIEKIVEKAESIPPQTIDDAIDYTFATLTPQLLEQKKYLKEIFKEKESHA